MNNLNQGASEAERAEFAKAYSAEYPERGAWDIEAAFNGDAGRMWRAARRTPAATTGASSVKPWKARIPMQSTTQECLEAACAEIADLRAQLAATKENLQAAVQEAWNRMTAQHRAEEQLAAKGQGCAVEVKPGKVCPCGQTREWCIANECKDAAPASAQPADPIGAVTRTQVFEEAADMLEAMNDSSGDAAAYDNREQNIYELEREHAIADCVKKLRDAAAEAGAQPDQRESAAEEMIGWAACGCHACNEGRVTKEGWPITATRMILCPTCGNKRCPRASDHTLACTGSNEPGQDGSVYGAADPSPAAQPVAKDEQ